MFKNKFLLSLLIFLCSVFDVKASQTCHSPSLTPDNRFVLKNGEAYDTETKLTWSRCVVGEKWSNGRCEGLAKRQSWHEAVKLVSSSETDWRMPGIDELHTINAGLGSTSGCIMPAWNLGAFGDNEDQIMAYFWSGSEYLSTKWGETIRSETGSVFAMFSHDGTHRPDSKESQNFIRLVRGKMLVGKMELSGDARPLSVAATIQKNILDAKHIYEKNMLDAKHIYEKAITAEKNLRCEEAIKLDKQAQLKESAILNENGKKIDLSECVSKRKFNSIVNGKDPQVMYLAAGLYESDGSRERAKTIYRQIVDRFSKNPLAIKAADRLTRLSDVETVESSNQESARRIERAQQQTANQVQQARDEASQRRSDFCSGKSSCSASCSSLSYGNSRDSCYSACNSKYSGCY